LQAWALKRTGAGVTAHAIFPIVFPDVALHFEYSTTNGVPG
jgi:thioredoxin reductase (NADPH)